MAGNITAPDRLSITTGAYDQVIALSQANINQSLAKLYTQHEDDERFFKIDFDSEELYLVFNGNMWPPTINLIDADGADRALLFFRFESGTYSTKGKGGKKFEYDIKDWVIAFQVSFAMTTLEVISDELKAMIQKPGKYDVHQILLTFGTGDLLNFVWDRCHMPNVPKEELPSLKTKMLLIMSETLVGLTDESKQKAEERNLLGYVVTSTKPAEVAPVAPSFVPVWCRPQIVGYRAHSHDSTDPEHELNAYVITEMTARRDGAAVKPPDRDLAWSGNFFYESVGGTIAMSRRLFWDGYMAEKLCIVNEDLPKTVGKVAIVTGGALLLLKNAEELLRADEASMYLVDDRYPSGSDFQWTAKPETSSGLQSLSWEKSFSKKRNAVVKAVADFAVEVEWKGLMSTHCAPIAGEGKVTITHDIQMNATTKIALDSWLQNAGWGLITSTLVLTWRYDLLFGTVDQNGMLHTSLSDVEEVRRVTDCTYTIEGPVEKLGPMKKYIEDILGDFRSGITNMVKEQLGKAGDSARVVAKGLSDALSGQNKFIFPGGRTFDMDRPIFANTGDLLMGLNWTFGET